MQHYPVYLDLRGRPCVVVGGSDLAEEKARGLLAAGAAVTVIAAEVTPELAELAKPAQLGPSPILWLDRDYRLGDLAGAFLAIIAVADAGVRETAWLEALRGNVLVNTVDDVPRCTFIAPAVVRRGDLAVAISTGGKAPALAVRLRQRLEAELGPEHARFLELAGRARAPLAARQPDFARRRDLWYALVDSDALELLRRGDEPAAVARFADILGVSP